MLPHPQQLRQRHPRLHNLGPRTHIRQLTIRTVDPAFGDRNQAAALAAVGKAEPPLGEIAGDGTLVGEEDLAAVPVGTTLEAGTALLAGALVPEAAV